MCRLLAVYLENTGAIQDLMECLKEASKYDFIAERQPKFDFNKHDDGWGLAVAYRESGEWRLLFYKTRKPVWEDSFFEAAVRVLERSERLIGIIHTRKASRNTPINMFNAHPFSFLANDGSLIYVAQNGGIAKGEAYKQAIARGYEFSEENVSDTFIYTALLASFYNSAEGTPPERLLNSVANFHNYLFEKGLSGRCVNTLVFQVFPCQTGHCFNLAIVRAYYNETYREYYDMFRITGKGLSQHDYVYCSSTVAVLLEKRGYKAELIERNKVILISTEREEVLVKEIP